MIAPINKTNKRTNRYSLSILHSPVSSPATPNLSRNASASFYSMRPNDPWYSRESLLDDSPSSPISGIPGSTSNCKILLIGDANVGKTAMILRYFNELPTKLQLLLKQKHTQHQNSNVAKPVKRQPSLRVVEREKLHHKEKNNQKRYSLNDLSRRRLLLFPISPTLPLGESHETEPEISDPDEIIIETKTTIGVDIKTKLINIDNRFFNCIFWDTAGQERYKNAIVPSLYNNCNGIILSYDICNYKSFENCFNWWMIEALNHLDLKKARFYLVGNKIDLYKERQVTHQDVLRWISKVEKKFGIMIYGNFEVTCKYGDIVEKTFNLIISDLVEHSCYEENKLPFNDEIDIEPSSPVSSISNSSLYSAEDKLDIPKVRKRQSKLHLPRTSEVIDITKPANSHEANSVAFSSCCT
ncbi:hypothetical protein KAFR_0A08400 [Kazachstania africana CBS 2517]|uniref:GTP-binding protein YPT11 n=1 Tax=Kazachstania africana (strain ATCC 22294 / BCRC 22015 / CBS 2517 / CECT 1963 / NBRC 1671 / NRRL Y-8276) TaxID=1071382 RepID=H2APH4_KAZAF|nr:hypothetical protein KAFR_0A08400 [Kazachstania africana CBS 2517]CCF56274.1 hypothetical protein KAFR_0A08400 [Kazachstania africana CBS 2517]